MNKISLVKNNEYRSNVLESRVIMCRLCEWNGTIFKGNSINIIFSGMLMLSPMEKWSENGYKRIITYIKSNNN